MSSESGPAPYDFSNWKLGEDALSDVEVAVLELIDQARDKTLRLNWPNFTNLHDAVIMLVRNQLAFAFDEHRSGHWSLNCNGEAELRWTSEVDEETATIILRPRQLIPLFIGSLSENLSLLPPVSDEQAGSYNDFDWDKNWLLSSGAIKQWQRAILASLMGLRALQAERRELVAREKSRHAEQAGDDP